MTSLACRPRDLIEAHLIILPVSAVLGWVRRFNWCSLSLSLSLSLPLFLFLMTSFLSFLRSFGGVMVAL